MKGKRSFAKVLAAIDEALLDCADPIDSVEGDKLVAARQCLIETRYTVIKGERRAFVKWCPKCDTAKPVFLWNLNRSKPDGLQTLCRRCQGVVYQEHRGELADSSF